MLVYATLILTVIIKLEVVNTNSILSGEKCMCDNIFMTKKNITQTKINNYDITLFF